MTTEEVLDVVRQRIGQAVSEIGGNAPTYPDDFLMRFIKTTNLELSVFGVTTGVVVDINSLIISPDPSTPMGMLLAAGAASSVISSDLLDRLKNGELGISFSSGASSISTNQAAMYLKQFADTLNKWYDRLLTAYLSGDPYAVIQRVT